MGYVPVPPRKYGRSPLELVNGEIRVSLSRAEFLRQYYMGALEDPKRTEEIEAEKLGRGPMPMTPVPQFSNRVCAFDGCLNWCIKDRLFCPQHLPSYLEVNWPLPQTENVAVSLSAGSNVAVSMSPIVGVSKVWVDGKEIPIRSTEIKSGSFKFKLKEKSVVFDNDGTDDAELRDLPCPGFLRQTFRLLDVKLFAGCQVCGRSWTKHKIARFKNWVNWRVGRKLFSEPLFQIPEGGWPPVNMLDGGWYSQLQPIPPATPEPLVPRSFAYEPSGNVIWAPKPEDDIGGGWGYVPKPEPQEPYPCRRLPREQQCDYAGPGGFMGHTCVAPVAAGVVFRGDTRRNWEKTRNPPQTLQLNQKRKIQLEKETDDERSK